MILRVMLSDGWIKLFFFMAWLRHEKYGVIKPWSYSITLIISAPFSNDWGVFHVKKRLFNSVTDLCKETLLHTEMTRFFNLSGAYTAESSKEFYAPLLCKITFYTFSWRLKTLKEASIYFKVSSLHIKPKEREIECAHTPLFAKCFHNGA